MDDLDALRLPAIAKVAGGIGLLLGGFQCILAVQSFLLLRPAWRFLVLAVMFGLGLILLRAGYRMTRGFGRGALIGAVAAAANGLVVAAWLVFALLQGVLSPLTLLVILLSMASLVFSSLTIPALRSVDAARDRLREEGLETGL
jgi:hypothetical protein